jgi:lipoprotein
MVINKERKIKMNKFSKFLKNKNTVTILGVLACLVILYAGYTMRINKKTALVDVYYAKETIQPKTLITEDMVAKMSVPASFIKGTYYKNYQDIVGKYSNYNTMIASGSIFYSDLLVEESNLPDAVLYNVNEGERVVSFSVDTVSTYGNSIMPGNIVDIYVKLYDDNDKLVYGEFYENIEILGVKDASGKNVFENTEEARTPSYIYFSLPEAKYLLFSSLNYIETNDIEVVLVPNTVKFDAKDPMATEVTSEYLYNFVLNKLEKIDNQKDLYNELLNEMEQSALEKENKQNNQ